jgi:hypothetical protein
MRKLLTELKTYGSSFSGPGEVNEGSYLEHWKSKIMTALQPERFSRRAKHKQWQTPNKKPFILL